MTDIKIIFFDIDGTLMDFGAKTLSPRTAEALRRLRAQGVRLCIATGRAPFLLPELGGVEFDAYLTFNGSLCHMGDTVLFSHPLCPADVQRLVQNAAALGRPVIIATQERMAANGTDQDLSDYCAVAGKTVPLSAEFDALCRQKEVYQLMLGCRVRDYPAILQGVREAKITAWWDRAADVIPVQGGKGEGVKKLLEYYGIPPAHALAFGDGGNDLEMLRAVGTGVAMGNASPQLKAAADEVCGEAAADGIYHYCLSHRLI